MTIRGLLTGLLRRWYIVVAGILVSAGLAGYLYMHIPPQYQRSASVLLVPGGGTIPEGGNPYLYLGGLGQASEVLLSTVNAPEVRDPILDDFPGGDVIALHSVTSSGPLITVIATANSDASADELLDRMTATLPRTLLKLQTAVDVPDKARITTLELGRDDSPTVIQKTRLQLTAILGAGGLVITVILAGLTDGLIAYRRRKRQEQEALEAKAQRKRKEPSDVMGKLSGANAVH